MERTQVYLTAEQKAALEALSKMKSVPMADLVREAIAEYLARDAVEYRLKVLDETFETIPEWKDIDGAEYVRNLRGEWSRREDTLWKGERGHEHDRG